MPHQEPERVVALTKKLIAVDSRSAVASRPVFDLMATELAGWELEYIDYVDANGTPKRNLVARCAGSRSRVAFAGHLDTVPDTGWTRKPFEAAIEGDLLYGLGASDMKGPIASFITAANSLPAASRPMLVLTSDEESGKQGVREVVARSTFLRENTPGCFVVAEPTALGVLRGHRVDVAFTVHARGIQAHSSTGKGRNANIALIPFLGDMRELHLHLREDHSLHDPQYDPPFADLNFVIDNYGAFPNTTVGLATCRIKFRYSKSFDPSYVIERVRASAAKHQLDLEVVPEAPPPELPPEHALVKSAEAILGTRARVAGLGTEASEYSKLAPCLVFGPGDIDHAHKPTEYVNLQQLTGSTELYRQLARNLLP
ncbi:M20/M25/M40 family metallo-hydrolase [Ramlibacter sp.]|uniref:M20/M25/M40 family metallo-hydrolase n=1 Tax=Ramlibacter sp. TaxID=1917967 RepID=UPI002620CEB6|nr:M20/M25/M40 family metallo-hydrolase [Ramlibacter sp.]MDB5954580.1 Acetylornithine deacetylase [Ramlibacter sp.]